MQQGYDFTTADHSSLAFPLPQISRGSVSHHPGGTSTSMPDMRALNQHNVALDLQAQGRQTQARNDNGTVFPRMVLQLNDVISEQQRQQQMQQQCLETISEHQPQQRQQKYLDAVGSMPLAPPPVPCPPLASKPGESLTSIGSMAHDAGKCKPCAFFHTKGCENGFDCEFCHVCEFGEKKKRRKEKIDNRRSMRQLRQALGGGLSSWWEVIRGSRQNADPD